MIASAKPKGANRTADNILLDLEMFQVRKFQVNELSDIPANKKFILIQHLSRRKT